MEGKIKMSFSLHEWEIYKNKLVNRRRAANKFGAKTRQAQRKKHR
jgi:hypothetical protein